MNRYLDAMAGAAGMLRDVAFLRLLIPVLMLVALVALVHYGIRGITQGETLVLGRGRADLDQVRGTYQGSGAVAMGVLYLALAVVIVAVLGPFSWFLWF